jgi:CRISPR-associated protein Cmr2
MKMWGDCLVGNIFVLKTSCLLHDPPNKAWRLRDHREEARKIASEILKGTSLEYLVEKGKIIAIADEMERIAKQADIYASSVDRWLLSKLVGEDYSLFPVEDVKLKNIFNPKFYQSIRERPAENYVNKFAESLNNLIRHIRDPRLAYHVLYASYEPIWIELGLPSGPADTRAPTHTVFDHNYATASMMNWLLKGREPDGILLYIDLGRVQRFISSSRKLRDLWVSSYLASALAWRLFWIFVRALGPDVMVLPTCRGNPFYYHSLISELIANGIDESVINEIKKISAKIAGYDPEKDIIPRYAVVPVTATFILPSLDVLKEFEEFRELDVNKGVKGLEEFVEKKYEEIWREIYGLVVKTLETETVKNRLGDLAVKARELLEECRKYGFDKVPPLPLRVIALSTSENGFKGERYMLYHHMLELLRDRENERKLYKSSPEERLELTKMTLQPVKTWPEPKEAERRKGFEYCSVCGRLPAIIVLPSDEEEYGKYLDLKLEPIFSMGERLCPYCLIKRLLSFSEILGPVVDHLLGRASKKRTSEGLKLKFPSVSDVALIPFKRSFVENVMKLDKDQRLAEELAVWINEILQKLVKSEEDSVMPAERDLLEKVKKMKSSRLAEELESMLLTDSEAAFLRTYRLKRDEKEEMFSPRREWLKLLERIRKHEEMSKYVNLKEIEGLNTYYVIAKCDADNMGKIIRGKVKEGFRITVEEYLSNALEGEAREVVKAIIEGRLQQAVKICGGAGVRDPEDRVNEVEGFIKSLKEKGEIIIALSYHSALSRALMANAIRDAEIVKKHDGITVYAGGDDLLALVPVKNSLKMVYELRKKFSFPSEDLKGFEKIKNYLIPSLATASRSFSIYITHYMFPLYTAISRSGELLEDEAKESVWVKEDEKIEKDTIALAYSPRGGEQYVVLPLSNIGDPERNLARSLGDIDAIISEIEEGRFSVSLIYDLYNSRETLKKLSKKGREALLEMVIRDIFRRNCEMQDKQQCEKVAEAWVRRLVESYSLQRWKKRDKEPGSYMEQFILALKLYRSGLRGVE